MTRRWFDDTGRNIEISLVISFVIIAGIVVAIIWPH